MAEISEASVPLDEIALREKGDANLAEADRGIPSALSTVDTVSEDANIVDNPENFIYDEYNKAEVRTEGEVDAMLKRRKALEPSPPTTEAASPSPSMDDLGIHSAEPTGSTSERDGLGAGVERFEEAGRESNAAADEADEGLVDDESYYSEEAGTPGQLTRLC